MKIGINALGLSSGRAGGIEIYFLDLVRSLSRYDMGNNYLIYTNHKKMRDMLSSSVNSAMRLKYVSTLYTYIAGGLVLLFSRPMLAIEAAAKVLSRQPIAAETTGILGKVVDMNGMEADVIHFPFGMIDPSFYDIKAPIVLTIPDIQHEYYPQFFDEETLSFRRVLYRSSAERADVIITISEAAKESMMEKFGTAEEKIVVTYTGCSEDLLGLLSQWSFCI